MARKTRSKSVPPRATHWLGEARVLLDAGKAILPLLLPVDESRPHRRRNIIVIPGFGAGDHVTWPLRRYLRKFDHHVEGWGLGVNRAGMDVRHTLDDVPTGWINEPIADYRNEGAVPLLCQRMTERVIERHEALGQEPLTLIGWSLGGVVAREVARNLPHLIEDVITLGTPVQGGPKYTRVAPLFKRRGMDLDLIERSIVYRERTPIQCRITAIASPTDGVVAQPATFDPFNRTVRHVEVDASHLGMCMNPAIWQIITDTLHTPL